MTNDRVTSALAVISRQAGERARNLTITEDMTLSELGLDSLGLIVTVVELEQALGERVFDENNVGQLKTVGDILRRVG